MKKNLIISIFLVLFIAISVFGVNYGGTLNYAIATEAVGLDPNLVTAFASFRILENVYDTLLKYDESMNIVPGLAESYEIVDPTTIVFTIRDGVKFHDGTPLTVDDVAFTFERILDENYGSPAASNFAEVESIKIIGDNKIEFKLKISMMNALLPNFTSGNTAIVSKAFVESGANMQLVTNGTGPFYISDYKAGNYIELKKNENYYEEGLPYLDGIKFHIIPEEISRVSAIRNGDVDLASLDEPTSVGMLAGNYKVFKQPVLNYYLLGINTAAKPLDDPKVRQAISYALNRENIIKMVAFGEGAVTGPMNPTVTAWALPPEDFAIYDTNIEKAKELLAEAGYPNGIEFSITCSAQYSFDKIAQVIQAQLAEAGIKVNIDLVEWGIFIDKWKKVDFDSFVSLNGGAVEPDKQFYRTFYSTGSTNKFNFSNEKADELLDAGRETVEYEKRKEIYDEFQNLIVDESPVIFLYCSNNIYAGQKSVEGFKTMSNGSLIFLREVWLNK